LTQTGYSSFMTEVLIFLTMDLSVKILWGQVPPELNMGQDPESELIGQDHISVGSKRTGLNRTGHGMKCLSCRRCAPHAEALFDPLVTS